MSIDGLELTPSDLTNENVGILRFVLSLETKQIFSIYNNILMTEEKQVHP